jgi:hypothetical protein
MREAGYNIHAVNPTSGAAGMAQFINGFSEYYQWGGNPNTAYGQSVAMVNYIKSRYGDPIAAANHERAYNWYAQGGLVAGTGKPPSGAAPAPRIHLSGGRAFSPAPGDLWARGRLMQFGQSGWRKYQTPVFASGCLVKPAFGTWLSHVKSAQRKELGGYAGLYEAFYTSLLHAPRGSWLDRNKTAVRERLYALAIKENAEKAAYAALVAHSSGTGANLAALPGRIALLRSRAAATARAIQPSLIGHVPGGHPTQVKAFQATLKTLTSLAGIQPYWPNWVPTGMGASHSVPGGVIQFDRGGAWPSGTLGVNLSGHTEYVSPRAPVRGTVIVENHLHVHGPVGSSQELQQWLVQSMNLLSRTGRLQQSVHRPWASDRDRRLAVRPGSRGPGPGRARADWLLVAGRREGRTGDLACPGRRRHHIRCGPGAVLARR